MNEKASLSVILPTFNCIDLMDRHIASVMSWADLADEIIVVDSRSNDGTFELIKQKLHHPNLRIIQRDRGLYESWNEGIAATTGDWVYISTAGDTIERAHLLKLIQMGESTQADVVISPFRPVNKNGNPYPESGFTNAKIHDQLSRLGSCVIEPPATFFFAFQKAKPNALLGSCASDLFRGEFLRARPFPTNYSTHGDTAWTLRHSSEMQLCLLPTSGSVFCIHPKPFNEEVLHTGKILDEIFIKELINAQNRLSSQKNEIRISLNRDIMLKARKAHNCRRKLRRNGKRIKDVFCQWFILTLKYIYFKICLAIHDVIQKRRLKIYVYSASDKLT